MLAAMYCDLDVVKLLVENGADLDMAEDEGTQAINYANYCEKSEVSEFIWGCMNKKGASCMTPPK